MLRLIISTTHIIKLICLFLNYMDLEYINILKELKKN
jgi:hypothetical protein